MIRFQIVVERFADSWVAKFLLKLARWRNWDEKGTSTRWYRNMDGEFHQTNDKGNYISTKCWNYRVASTLITKIKRWEENKAADQLKKDFEKKGILKTIKPESGHGLDFDSEVYDLMLEVKNTKL